MAQRHVAYVNARGEFIDNAYSNNWCGWEQRATCPRCREMSRDPRQEPEVCLIDGEVACEPGCPHDPTDWDAITKERSL